MLRMALIALLMAGVPVMGAADVSAAPGKSKAEKSAKRKAERKHGKRSEDRHGRRSEKRVAERPRKDSSRDKVHIKKKKEKPRTVTTRVREFNRKVYKVARRGADWVNPYSKHYKRKYRAPARSRFHRRGCTAVAKKRYGAGRRIRGVSSHKYGSRACRRALKQCRRELRRRQYRGRNPNARCVVAYRG